MKRSIEHLRKTYKTRMKASDPASWKPVASKVEVPVSGVTLGNESSFRKLMAGNIDYLVNSFDVDHMLYPFRIRAGFENPPVGSRGGQVKFWDTDLPGSNAGRFLMGAANTLRWIDHPELRKMLDAVVDGIAECSTPEGYFYPWEPEHMLFGKPGTNWACAQQSNYCRPWLSHGLIDAFEIGNRKALSLLRKGQDWFNACEYLPDISKVILWAQGHIANTRIYFTPVGRPEDIQVAEKYYVSDEWLERVTKGDLEAIWVDGHGYPHVYILTVCEAYLDHYFATGEETYLDAMLSVWDMIHTYWEHVGGSLSINEGEVYPPHSRFSHPRKRTGEHCGNVFWAKINQRLHRLYPDEEKYVAEIEKSIWNVTMASQDSRNNGIRYSTILDGMKHAGNLDNTCCEGQGTRMMGSLPEFIYSIAPDGIYVSLFEASSIDTVIGGTAVRLEMATRFPYGKDVELRVSVPKPVSMKLRIRVPSWAAGPMPISVNGKKALTGTPGTFSLLDRVWNSGDSISFTLPMEFRCTKQEGMDHHLFTSLIGLDRYGIEYGPILFSVVYPAPANGNGSGNGGPENGFTCNVQIYDYALIYQDPGEIASWLIPDNAHPLNFRVVGHPEYRVKPYFRVDCDEFFSCFPVMTGALEAVSQSVKSAEDRSMGIRLRDGVEERALATVAQEG